MSRFASNVSSRLKTATPKARQHPSNGKININTAPALVLESLHSSFTPSLVQEILEYREETPFRSTREFLQHFVPDSQTRHQLNDLISVESDTFSVSSTGIVGNIAVTVKAVLSRLPKKNQVKNIYWRFEG